MTLLQKIALAILQMAGWKIVTNLPDSPKYVIIGAYHTWYWDFLFAVLYKFATGLKFHWIAKDTVFRWPSGWFARKLGGIPVNRRLRSNLVAQIFQAFRENEELIVAVAPEGTLRQTKYWRSGFYYMALGAGVPIALGFIDYGHKIIGVDGFLLPSGDIQADFGKIREFYADKTGKYPHKQGEIKLRPRKAYKKEVR